MRLVEFINKFPDEGACRKHWKELREKEGLTCPKCGCHGKERFRWKGYREQWECKECGHRIGLRAGTVMQSSKLPFRNWFIAMHLLTATKKSISSKELQRQLDRNRYQPVWEMVNKIHDVMGKRDNNYKLTEQIELDDGFFTTDREEEEKLQPTKRGRGSQDKTKVVVMTESAPAENSKSPIKKTLGHVKMIVIPDLRACTIDKEVKEHIEKDSILTTDASNSYVNFKDLVKEHNWQVIEPKNVGKVLPWVHIAISNAKKLLLDMYHHVSVGLLQGYLNEFCYKLNRRCLDIFQRLTVACCTMRTDFTHRTYTCKEAVA